MYSFRVVAPNILRERHDAKENQHCAAGCLCVRVCVCVEKDRERGSVKECGYMVFVRNEKPRRERERKSHLDQVKQQKWNFSLPLLLSVYFPHYSCVRTSVICLVSLSRAVREQSCMKPALLERAT